MSLGLWILHYQKIELQGFSNAFQLFSLNIFVLPCLVSEFGYLEMCMFGPPSRACFLPSFAF